jgi:hypothetical protein
MGFPTKSLPQIERRPNVSAAFPTTYSVALFVSEIRFFWRNAVTFEVELQERHCIRRYFLRFFGWQNLLKTDLIDEVFAFQVDQMRPLLSVGQMRRNFEKVRNFSS